MRVKTGVIREALASCFMEDEGSSVLCSISLEQKLEADPSIDILFLNQEIEQGPIRTVLEPLFLSKSGSTQIKVCQYAFRSGSNLFSAMVNAFSICAVLSGLELADTLCSSTAYVGNGEVSEVPKQGLHPVHMAYRMHSRKIVQFAFNTPLDMGSVRSAIGKLVKTCTEQGARIRLEVAKAVEQLQNTRNHQI
jgi:ribonuclease PH